MEYAYGVGAVASTLVNGAAFGDYGPTLRALKDVGEDAIQINLYGVGKIHNRFAGRRGDFDLINRIAEDAVEAGLGLYFRIFVTKGNVSELDAIDSYVRRFGEAVLKAWYDLWVLAGRGYRAESLRIDETDRETITVKLPAGCLSEREIIAKLDAGEIDASHFAPRYNMLSFAVGENGVHTYEHTGRVADVPVGVEDDEKLLKYLSRKKEEEMRRISRTPDLVAEYGDVGNRRLYTPGGYRQLIFRRAGIC